MARTAGSSVDSSPTLTSTLSLFTTRWKTKYFLLMSTRRFGPKRCSLPSTSDLPSVTPTRCVKTTTGSTAANAKAQSSRIELLFYAFIYTDNISCNPTLPNFLHHKPFLFNHIPNHILLNLLLHIHRSSLLLQIHIN